jgi:tetratricopeptide (TPR) repeat protein
MGRPKVKLGLWIGAALGSTLTACQPLSVQTVALEIREMCSASTAQACLEEIKKRYSTTLDDSKKHALLIAAINAYLELGDQSMAIRLMVQALPTLQSKSIESSCESIRSTVEKARHLNRWLFLDRFLSELNKLPSHRSCLTTLNATVIHAMALYELGRYRESLNLVDQVFAKGGSQDSTVDFLAAKNSFMLGDYDRCIDQLKFHDSRKRHDSKALSLSILLASCLEHKELYPEALAVLDHLIATEAGENVEMIRKKRTMIEKRTSMIEKRLEW